MKRWSAPVVVLGLVLAACGSDDDGGGGATDTASSASETTQASARTEAPSGTDASSSTEAPSGTDASASTEAPADTGPPDDGGNEPFTLEHRFGTTEIAGTPTRLVALDTQWTDVLAALGAPMVAAGLDPTIDGERYPWQASLSGDLIDLPASDSIPFEAVAAARPDAIFISYFLEDQADYDRLSQIAPVIPLLGDEQVDAWQDMARTAGEILDMDEEAEELIAAADQASADLLAELPGLEGKTYALANYVPGDAIYVVADPDDGAGIVFGQLGLEIDPELLEIADGAAGRVELSLERINELDSDLLIMLTNGAETSDIVGYDLLPAVQDGAVAILDLQTVVGLNTPTPLSVPYAIDAIRPALEAAAT